MAKPSRRKRSRRRGRGAFLLKNGLTAVVLGAGLLAASALLSGPGSARAALSTALSMPAWWAIGVGVVLIAAHGLGARRHKGIEQQTLTPPKASARLDSKAIMALIDQAERAFAFSQIDPDDDTPTAAARRKVPGSPWGPAVFAAIEWRRFEAVCEALFTQAGFETRSQSLGADGGVDLWLHSQHAKGPAAVVRCKHWQGKPVGVNEMQAFLGVITSHGLKRGTYATTSKYTPEAQTFAAANGINALNVRGLLALVVQRTPEQQTALLAIAFEGEYWRPTCASCGVKMVDRLPGQGAAAFWGCANFPNCRHTMPKRDGPLPH